MLNVLGDRYQLCDGISRRSFLNAGTFAFAGTTLSLTDIFRAEAQAGQTSSSHKAVINIFLGGGPPHQDMWDIKTDAPKEIRGEFNPISTKIPGIQIGEVFPKLAALMDRCAIIRSVVGATGGHDAAQCLTGYGPKEFAALGGRPSIGSAAAKVLGPTDPSVPPFVGLAAQTKHMPWSDHGKPGFLGATYAAFKPEGPGLDNLKLNSITLDQLQHRRRLLQGFDDLKRELDTGNTMTGMDALTERAMGVLTSSRLLEALDLSKESEKVRQRYGDGQPYQFQYDGAPTVNDQLLMARRLVEAGVRVVTLSYGRWDSHGQNFKLVRDHGAKLDQGLSALIEDLEIRGMLNDVTVIAWGEFGRTPRINNNAGRDHWPQVSCAFLAGGGMKLGQAIGSTTRLGEFANNRPVHFQEIIATLYHNLGINPSTTSVLDQAGRPQHLIEMAPLTELV